MLECTVFDYISRSETHWCPAAQFVYQLSKHVWLIQVRKTLRDSVKDIIHQVGVTSILVTHDQEEAFDIADKVVIFNR